MDWLVQNWVWVVLLAVFIWMHLFGHGSHWGHGGHGGHSGHRGGEKQRQPGGEQPSKDD